MARKKGAGRTRERQRQRQPRTDAVREIATAYAASGLERPRRKNYYLRQSKIDLAKRILGTRTETEAVDHALDLVIYGEALARGTEAMAGEEYVDVLGIAEEAPEAD